VSRPPAFADRRTASVAAATAAALVALEVADLAALGQPGDRVADGGTGALVAGAIAVAVGTTAASLLRPQRRPLPRNAWGFGAGVGCTWAGIGVNRLARRALGARYRPVVTVVADHDVVDGGPYRHVRHPMYLGSTLLCAGLAVALGTAPTASAWLLPPLALLRRIAVEERVLAEALGDRYRDYAEGRARLVPGVW
jgi:protein-S-isoprenylcysteine O-methyltransferase Ste14